MSSAPYDFTTLAARNGEIVVRGLLNPAFHGNGVPSYLVFHCDLWVGNHQYLFEVERAISGDWKIDVNPSWHWTQRATLTLVTPAVRRSFKKAYYWSPKAAALLRDNLQSIQMFLYDEEYQEGLLRALQAQWKHNQLERQRAVAERAFQAITDLESELAALEAQGTPVPQEVSSAL
jgi:hypothetical protein